MSGPSKAPHFNQDSWLWFHIVLCSFKKKSPMKKLWDPMRRATYNSSSIVCRWRSKLDSSCWNHSKPQRSRKTICTEINTIELKCDIECELTIPPSCKNEVKTITFSSRQNINDVERDVKLSLVLIIQVNDDHDDNDCIINEDKQEYRKMIEEGNENPIVLEIGNIEDERYLLRDDH